MAVTAEEVQERYAAAVERRALAERAWIELGRPLLAEGGATGRAPVPHPLVTMLKELDVLCDRLGKSVKARDAGRPVGAASAPDREPPRVRLAS